MYYATTQYLIRRNSNKNFLFIYYVNKNTDNERTIMKKHRVFRNWKYPTVVDNERLKSS